MTRTPSITTVPAPPGSHPQPRHDHHPDPDAAWRAVLDRDGASDGRFVYAVTTTGIYCRPSCPARRPRREHVRFLSGPAAAQREGFRACKRCRPDDRNGTDAERAVAVARRHLETHVDRRVTLADLAALTGVTAGHLQRTFTRLVGVSPREYQHALRYDAFRDEARASRSVIDGAFGAGFGSSRGLYDQAKERLGMTPGAYRRGGRGITIDYETCETRHGTLLAAWTADGVCAVFLGGDDDAVETELRREFPAASVHRRGGGPTPAALTTIAAVLDGGPDDGLEQLPLDLGGSAFDRAVWQVLRTIPRGETRTYGEIAAAVGKPRAARAVGQACARNRLAVVVPCHRVLRTDGGVGSYRWGAERKTGLLEREHAI